jgi:RimJ/RimL family protein N-acetyltransferase
VIGEVEEIVTDRLRLVPLRLADATVIVHGRKPDGARWAPGYPTDGTLVAAGVVIRAQEEGRHLGPFRTYQIVRREGDLVIGDCGFHGPPDEDGTVHVGYGVAEVERGHRFAGEALQALISWAHGHPDVRRVLGDAARTNIASIIVMERAGMRRIDEDDDLVYYEG